MLNTSRVTIHIVSSLDGFIAKKDGSFSRFQSINYHEKKDPKYGRDQSFIMYCLYDAESSKKKEKAIFPRFL